MAYKNGFPCRPSPDEQAVSNLKQDSQHIANTLNGESAYVIGAKG
jgi:hypothetical protein